MNSLLVFRKLLLAILSWLLVSLESFHEVAGTVNRYWNLENTVSLTIVLYVGSSCSVEPVLVPLWYPCSSRLATFLANLGILVSSWLTLLPYRWYDVVRVSQEATSYFNGVE